MAHLGPMDSFTAFSFENCLYSIEKLVRKPNFPVGQVVHRLEEINKNAKIVEENDFELILLRKSLSGPVPDGIYIFAHYQKVVLRNYSLSIKTGDNAFMVGEDTFILKNIVALTGDIMLIAIKFMHKQDFFEISYNSLKLHIAHVTKFDICIYQRCYKYGCYFA